MYVTGQFCLLGVTFPGELEITRLLIRRKSGDRGESSPQGSSEIEGSTRTWVVGMTAEGCKTCEV